MTQLETDRLILREWKDSDREGFIRMNSDPMVMEFLPRILDPQSSDKLMQRFKDHFTKYGYGPFAMEVRETGEFIGFVGLHHVELDVPFVPAMGIAWRLDYEAWGQGYATEGIRRVLKYAFEDLKLPEVVAFTVHDNSTTIHLMEKIGMKRDEKGDFAYPTLPKDHPFGDFVLYRITPKDLKAA